ncbi:neuronal calcium sensor 2 [Eurytemora carolleeae]|uniref:neuronal calcium sensor 2 n=1 Tax=Eurytemora carolleeae TaxID=1294199 RepID=UPI000C78995B|nr:neuronal calcium sensor 2 [Eurytemora carolleeae]|eukprot:XP_023333817.1 neuronal calcium sensor 2-like [Eurytemora affinis]
MYCRRMGIKNGKPVLRNDDILAFSHTSGLSEEQIKVKFDAFTADHPKGKIDRKSFRKMLTEAFLHSKNPMEDVEKMEKHIFRIYDTNNDGHIDFIEFMVVFHVLSEGTPEDVLRKLFRLFDVNCDGNISKKEMLRLVKDLHGLSTVSESRESIADSAFAEMDNDGDGVVTCDEFVNAVLQEKKVSKMLTMNVIDIFVS